MGAEKILSKDTERVFYEEWKPIQGYEDYEVSNHGNIRRNGRMLNPCAWSCYKTIPLRKNGKTSTKYVHRLVAQAFIPNTENKECVNHIDCNKLNNSVENLEWCTRQENERHAWRNGLKEKIRETSRENQKIAILFCHKVSVSQYSLDGDLIKVWDSEVQAMKETGIDSSAISKCCRGKLKKTGGYKWRFTE